MPLNPEPFPDDAQAAFLMALGDQPPGGPLHSTPVYAVTLGRLASGEGLRGAQKVGWHFMTTQEQKSVSGDVPDAPVANQPLAASVSQGPTIAAIWNAYEQLAGLQEVVQQQFKPRILRIPGLHTEAFWLKSESDDLDYLVPFLTFARELRDPVPLTRAKFEEIVQGLANRQLSLRDQIP